jgi:hypothetical protein
VNVRIDARKTGIFATWLLPMLLLLTLPGEVNAQFTFTTNNGAITITGYTGSGGAVIISDMTNGYPVTNIGTNAFAGLTSLTSVSIPNGITNIGQSAFEECSRLSSVTMGTNLIAIGTNAFFECGIASLIIPNNQSI